MKCANALTVSAALVASVACNPAKSSSKSTKPALSTVSIAIPTFAEAFTRTIAACHDTSEIVVVGHPNGNFTPGTTTAFLPPEAEAISTKYVDKFLNLTEHLVATPLPGSCAPLSIPASATDTVTASKPASATTTAGSGGWNSTTVCPTKGCFRGVDRPAQVVISALNQVTYASQKLQATAARLGGRWDFLDDDLEGDAHIAERFSLIHDLIIPLKEIPAALVFTIPHIQTLSPFPGGCVADTIVIAFADFVQVEVALLETLTVDAQYLNIRFVRPLIAGTLRALKVVTDYFGYELVELVSSRRKCIEIHWDKLDGALLRATAAYSPRG